MNRNVIEKLKLMRFPTLIEFALQKSNPYKISYIHKTKTNQAKTFSPKHIYILKIKLFFVNDDVNEIHTLLNCN